MTHMIRQGVVVAMLAGLACGSSGASASQSQGLSSINQLLKGIAIKPFTGTVVVNDSAAGTSSTDDKVISKSTTTASLNNTVVLTVTDKGVVAKITYAFKLRVDHEARYQYHKVVGYKTEDMTASGTNGQDAQVTVDLRSGGAYQINFSSGGVIGDYRMFDTADLICTNLAADPSCRPGTTSSNDAGKPPSQGGVAGSVDGRIDPKQPNVLVGSVTQPLNLPDGSSGNRTITWNLSR